MTQINKLFNTPPYAVESALKILGANLHTARLRRNLTLKQVAEKIGTGVRAVADAEKGKITTAMGVYVALLWVFGLVAQLEDVASPSHDKEGETLALLKEPTRARKRKLKDWDNDF